MKEINKNLEKEIQKEIDKINKKEIKKRISAFKTISVSEYTNQCIGYTAKILGLSKAQLLSQIFSNIIKEVALLKSDGNLEISHDNGLVSLKFTGRPFCVFGTLSIPTSATDKEIDKAIFEKVYGEKIID